MFYNPANSTSTEMFRYDTLYILQAPRNGTLYFYNNTVVNYAAQSQRYGTGLFCLPTLPEVQAWGLHDVLDCRNNIFANLPATSNGLPTQVFFLISDASTVNLGTNWMSPGFEYYQLPYQSNTFFGTFTPLRPISICSRRHPRLTQRGRRRPPSSLRRTTSHWNMLIRPILRRVS